MITDSFNPDSRELIDPGKAIPEKTIEAAKKYRIRTFILVFSHKLVDELVKQGVLEILDSEVGFGSSAMKNPVYRIKGTYTGVLLTGIGAAISAAMVEELHAAFNCRNFIVFGSCGALVEIPEGKLIVPVEAYRDEGISYHYAEAGDYIRIRNAEKLTKIFDELGVEYVSGKTWTTDAFYRETEAERDRRVSEGCICVEMECSALQAVCDFRGLELYQFVYAADSLSGNWTRRILGNLEMDARTAYFVLAEKIAERI